MRSRQIAALTAALVLAFPAFAGAASTAAAPPGNSAVDQYRESVPTSGAAGENRRLSKTAEKQLNDSGTDGEALAKAIGRTGGVASPARVIGTSSKASGTNTSSGAGTTASGSSAKVDPRSGGGSESSIIEGSSPKPVLVATAAKASVGPFPVWTYVLAALFVMGFVVATRRRAS